MSPEPEPARGRWPQHVVEILGGDLVVALASKTPGGGVVITPVSPLGAHDPDEETVTVTTSLAFPHKLRRMAGDDKVAVFYHAREHGFARSPHLVLIQGHARFPDTPDGFWTAELEERWNRFLVPRKTGLFWDWLGREYYDLRIPVTVQGHRTVVWPQPDAADPPTVFGPPLSGTEPAEQSPPAGGKEPRVDIARYRRRLQRSRHILVGHVEDDGYPMLTPVRATIDGRLLSVTGARLPQGGRRAGILAHWFEAGLKGQGQTVFTGWLQTGRHHASYAPHTVTGYVMPRIGDLTWSIAVGVGSKLRYRRALRTGDVRDGSFVRDE